MDRLLTLLPELWAATFETLYVVSIALLFGGLAGLLLGLALYATRPGSLFPQRAVFGVLNVVVNFFRPIPFVILLAAVQPLARGIGIPGIGPEFGIFAISLASMFAISRIVEQNLLTVDRGVIEAARAAGASRSRILFRLVPREALGPLILGYTFILVALVDMTAIAGAVAAGGLGEFAIVYGFRQFNPAVTWAAVLVIIVIVQAVQFLGNALARKVLRR
ncbi:methionine ABC transporter permease [Microbacterium aurantiacum]|uniref:ABC transporter permease subunit n=2 Tax=Microbacterium aurantiacum TaxID=162393 RepID=A0AAJ2HNT1_9MICO|nr:MULTISPECIES: ABC transporter permease subunit [Microbacterium]ODT10630.1 MAG: methionine ABC transporter ATP-binding protein [Microbacterium sp. SCN 70-18]ANG86131.1 methionine ABC transporter ATP-binding protein [Microbacterium chocolatum]KOS09971.1 methionine ABC transporter ATP-binding protein [Microbacterium chocolatum]MBN9200248.1 ABC transporter permease subunit [Microbacterium chocolatum]MDN4464288.1 ABC transporter permease subunit [Microbacterium aurantiacum]